MQDMPEARPLLHVSLPRHLPGLTVETTRLRSVAAQDPPGAVLRAWRHCGGAPCRVRRRVRRWGAAAAPPVCARARMNCSQVVPCRGLNKHGASRGQAPQIP